MSRLVRPRPVEASDYWVIRYEDPEGRSRTKVLGSMDKARATEERILFDAEQVRLARIRRGEVEAPPPEAVAIGGAAPLDEFLRAGYLHHLSLLDDREQAQRLRTLGHVRRIHPGVTLDELNTSTIQRGYLEQRKAEEARWNTRRLEVACWNELLRDAAARGALSGPASKMKNIGPKDGRRFRFLETDEIGALRAYFAARATAQASIRRVQIAVELGLYCGLRPGEITSRRWSDFDLERGRLEVDHVPEIDFRVKRDQVRTVPLPDELVEQLRVYRSWCGADAHWFLQRNRVGLVWQLSMVARRLGTMRKPVSTARVAQEAADLAQFSGSATKWPWYVGTCLHKGTGMLVNQGRGLWAPSPRFVRPEPIRVRSFSNGLRRAAEGAGIPHVWPHALRHSWASLALLSGVPLHVVQAIGGWKTPHVLLEIYAHVHPDRAVAVMRDFTLDGLDEAKE